jgi:hypothetical protein
METTGGVESVSVSMKMIEKGLRKVINTRRGRQAMSQN